MGPQIVPATGFSVTFQISEEHSFVFDSIVIGSEVTGYLRGLHSLSTQRAQRLDEVQHEVGPLDILYKDIKIQSTTHCSCKEEVGVSQGGISIRAVAATLLQTVSNYFLNNSKQSALKCNCWSKMTKAKVQFKSGQY